MKNVFKLKAIYRIAGIVALAALIGFSFVACDDGAAGPGGYNPGGGGGGNPNGLTVTGLPSISGQWYAYVYPQGYTFTTGYDADHFRMYSENEAQSGNSVGGPNTFYLWDRGNKNVRWRKSGNWPVMLQNNSRYYYVATVNFSNGSATVPWSSFREIPDYE